MVSILDPAIVLASRKSLKLSEYICISKCLKLFDFEAIECQAKTRFVWKNQEANQIWVITLIPKYASLEMRKKASFVPLESFLGVY